MQKKEGCFIIVSVLFVLSFSFFAHADTSRTVSTDFNYCPIVLNSSSTLSADVTANTTCVGFGANNIELDCQGHRITWNLNGENGTSAIQIFNKTGITLKNCVLFQGNGTGANTTSINLSSANSTTIQNNTIQTNGSASNYGITMGSGSIGTVIYLNTIYTTAAAGSNRGVFVEINAHNTTIAHNTIHATGGGTDSNIGIYLGAHLNTIQNNTIHADSDGTGSNVGVYFNSSSGNTTVSNNTINTHGVSGNVGIFILALAIGASITNNTITTNGSTSNANDGIDIFEGFANITGNYITVHGIGTTYGVSAYPGYNMFIENNTIIVNDTTSGNAIYMSDAANVTIQRNNITANGSTQNIGISVTGTEGNISILSNTVLANEGIVVSAPNTTIQNNTVNVTNGGSEQDGIVLGQESGNSVVLNNTVTINATSGGMRGLAILSSSPLVANNTVSSSAPITGILTGGLSQNVTNNTVFIMAGSTSSRGINGGNPSSTTVHRIIDNRITINGTGANIGYSIQAFGGQTAQDGFIVGNTLNISGETGSSGFSFSGGTVHVDNFLVANNTITMHGTSTHGILLTSSMAFIPSVNNNFTGNNITVNGPASFGFSLGGDNVATNSFFILNRVTVNDPTGYAVWIGDGRNNNFSNNVFISNGGWVNTSLVNSADRQPENNFTNTTFQNANGSINFPDRIFINVTQDINSTGLNITANRTFVNVTNMTFFNTSARLTWYNISFTDPLPVVDTADTGLFGACSDCTEVSFSGGNYAIDVTHFTTYAAQETPVPVSSGGSSGGGGSAGRGSGSSSVRRMAANPATSTPTASQTPLPSFVPPSTPPRSSSSSNPSVAQSASAAASTYTGTSQSTGITGLAVNEKTGTKMQLQSPWKKAIPIAGALIGIGIALAMVLNPTRLPPAPQHKHVHGKRKL